VSTVILSAVFTGFARSKMPVALGAVIMKSKVTAEHSQGHGAAGHRTEFTRCTCGIVTWCREETDRG
jgi:hypothetical protein